MSSIIATPDDYFNSLTNERKVPMLKLRQTLLDHLPDGLVEVISYGMVGYVVPHSIYPKGYHCNPELPLPFISIASQKNFIALYHMGIYADETIKNWFVSEYPKYVKTKLDMGKSCIRFKKVDQIPFDLITELVKKMSVKKWVELYERKIC